MIKLKSTAVVLLMSAALAGCGAGAGAPPAAGSAGTAPSTGTAAETSAAGNTADGQEAAQETDQRQTVIGELYKLPKEQADWNGLTDQEKLEDFDYLYQTLKENFPYLELIKRAQGVDMEQEYETYRAEVEHTETDMQFFVLIQQFIGTGNGIGHLDLLTPGFYDWMVEACRQRDGIPEEALPSILLLAEEYTNAASAAAYGAMADVFQETMDRVTAYNAALAAAEEKTAPEQETTGVATLVGRVTGGDGIGVDPIPVVMKNSGLIVRYSPVYGVTPDGAGSQEFGTEPDMTAADGESELDACLKAITMQ